MKVQDYSYLGVLAILAAAIWRQETSSLDDLSDNLPLLAALPLGWWLGRPWSLDLGGRFLDPRLITCGVVLFVLGSAVNSAGLVTLGWTAGIWAWLQPKLKPEHRKTAGKLLIFPIMAFPWLEHDAALLGWWFRLSGAWFNEMLFAACGLAVTREGTQLLVEGQPVAVSAACAGLKALQSLLIAGSLLAYLEFGRSRLYWWNVAVLVPLAWIANTARIAAISIAALTWGSEFAMGSFHALGGLGVLFLMFVISSGLFTLESRLLVRREPISA